MSKTLIQISTETWKKLNSLKDVGDSFDDVIKRLIEEQKNGC